MSASEELLTAVAEAVASLAGVPRGRVSASTRIAIDLGIDSVQAVELLLDVEERFGCRIAEAVLRDVRTVAELAAAIAGAGGGDAPTG